MGVNFILEFCYYQVEGISIFRKNKEQTLSEA